MKLTKNLRIFYHYFKNVKKKSLILTIFHIDLCIILRIMREEPRPLFNVHPLHYEKCVCVTINLFRLKELHKLKERQKQAENR